MSTTTLSESNSNILTHPSLQNLSLTLCSPISPAAIEKYGEDVRQNPVGAGPYILKEWVKGDRIVMVRNENYYGPKPTVAQLTFKIVPEDTTREAMLRSGQIDVCYKPLPSNVAALKADPNITVEMPLATRTIFMGLNYKKGVTKDKLVPQAFNYGFSAHADQRGLLEWLAHFRNADLEVFVIHGGEKVSLAFAQLVHDRFHFRTNVPQWGEQRTLFSPEAALVPEPFTPEGEEEAEEEPQPSSEVVTHLLRDLDRSFKKLRRKLKRGRIREKLVRDLEQLKGLEEIQEKIEELESRLE